VPGRFDRAIEGPATEAVPAWVDEVLAGQARAAAHR
jgi:hypothetical protein